MCCNHQGVSFGKGVLKSCKTWKITIWKRSRMPKSCSYKIMMMYLCSVFNEISTRKIDLDSKKQELISVFDHIDKDSKHESSFCIARQCLAVPASEMNHPLAPKSLCDHLKKDLMR
eukprot:114844_1